MAKSATRYVCQACGAVSAKWSGRCEACGEWNSIVEEASAAAAPPNARAVGRGRAAPLTSLGAPGESDPPRLPTGLGEFDRVLGGGLVAGSAVLVGGDPGVGKSTLLLQMAAHVAAAGARMIYLSGEEAAAQVRLRARRLELETAPVQLGAETNLAAILATLEQGSAPAAVVIDSIQTLWADTLEAAPGTVSQVRLCAQELVRFAKRSGAAVLIVGHVTKDGQIAGPRVVEHLVDTVLYFEGERGHAFRIVRAVKNRFGPTDEIGVFEMTGAGLAEVANPSALFLGEREERAPGAAVFAGIEGTRPLLVEVQALVAPAGYGTGRRAVVGADSARLNMILAVLDARCGLAMGGSDVFLNVAGGLRIAEPAADLAAAAALVSSHLGRALPPDAVFFGEIALSGAVRPVTQAETRIKEARKLGFRTIVAPDAPEDGGVAVRSLGDLIDAVNAELIGSRES